MRGSVFMFPKSIQINNQMIIIIGPTTSGKTTLAYKIQEQYHAPSKVISQENILKQEELNQSQEALDSVLHQQMASAVQDAFHENKDQLIILDTLNIGMDSVSDLISTIKATDYFRKFTLLKSYPSIQLHRTFCEMKNDSMEQSLTEDEIKSIALGQRLYYESNHGSLKTHFPYSKEYIVFNPTTVNFSFSLGSRPYYKVK